MANGITKDQAIRELARRELAKRQQGSNPLTDILSSSEPTPDTGDPVINALLGIQKEFVGPLAQGANTAALGIPKFLTRAIGGEDAMKQTFAEQSTGLGKTARFGSEVAGLFGGGAARLAGKAGKAFAPPLAKKAVEGGIGLGIPAAKMRGRAVLINKILRGAIEGSVFGGAQLDVSGQGQPTVGGQLGQAATGGAFGAVIPMVGSKMKGLGRGIKKFKTPSKPPITGRLGAKLKEKSEETIAGIIRQREIVLGQLDEATAKVKQRHATSIKAGQEAGVQNLAFKKKLDDTVKMLNGQVSALDDALRIEQNSVAIDVHKRLPEFYRSGGARFKEIFDDVAREASEQGKLTTIKDINAALDRAAERYSLAGIEEGPSFELLGRLKNEIFKIDDLGSNLDEFVPVETFFNQVKNFRTVLTSGAKTGATRYTQNDVGVSILNFEFGKIIESQFPKLARLREAYKPFIDTMTKSNKIFKPFQSEYNIEKAQAVLGRISKVSPKVFKETIGGEIGLIRAIEQGSEFAPGIGKITGKMRTLANNMKLSKARITPIKQELATGNLLFKESVDRKFVEQLERLAARREFVNANSINQENMIATELKRRLKELGVRKGVRDALIKDKAKMMAFIRNTLFAITGAGVIGGAIGMRR